jgi:CubicO group peptidase (beta-lactamase class C family)
VAVGLIGAATGSAPCETLPPQVRGPHGHILADYLDRLSGYGYSGAVLVAVDGEVVLRHAYGFADREKRIANRPETVFDIGSLTKTLTATAILQLEGEGKLSVQDPLSKFLPDLSPDKQAITLHQLLTHTSGLTGPEHAYRDVDKADAVHSTLAAPLKFESGSRWEYSNAGYVVLAAVIEAVSGEPYQEYLTRRVFRPAGMTSTGFWGARLPPVASRLLAKGYDELGVVADLANLSGSTWNDIGSGQVVSTVDDLYRFQRSLEHHRVLSASGLQRMLTPAMREPPSKDYYNSSYGYGMWAQALPDGTYRFHHGGDFLGFGSQLTWLPDRKVVVVSLCNVRNDLYPVHRRADRAIPDLLAGVAVEAPPRYRHLGRRALGRMLGTYVLPSGGRLTVLEGTGGLSVGADGQDAAIFLDGHFDDEQSLATRGQESRRLLVALLQGDDSGLVAVGLGDPGARRDIRAEIDSLRNGRGPVTTVRNVGTYVGGLLGRSQNALMEVEFERGAARYKMQWNGGAIVATDPRCPRLAAVTLVQPVSSHELAGWNVATLKGFSLQFDKAFETLTVASGGRRATATRLPLNTTGERNTDR